MDPRHSWNHGAKLQMRRGVAGNIEKSDELMGEKECVSSGETIAAISTPTGEGAIALIRISGPEAIAIADRIYRGKQKPSQFLPGVAALW